VADAERGAAARVAVHLGEDHGVDATAWLKRSATVTASWPVIASTTSSTWCGLTAARICLSSSEHRLVDVQASRRVEDQRREPSLGGRLEGGAADLDRRPAGVADDGTSSWAPSVLSCSWAAGR